MEQIQFLDNFLRDFGFHGIHDYKTKITTAEFKDDSTFLQRVNACMPKIRELFKTKEMNLSRKKYVIDSPLLAISVLKKCLHQANVPFETVRTDKCNLMRLKPINIFLMDYIAPRMDDITQSIESKEVKISDFKSDFLERYLPMFVHSEDSTSSYTFAITALVQNNDRIIVTESKRKYEIKDINLSEIDSDYVIDLDIPRYSDLFYDLDYILYDGVTGEIYKDIDVKDGLYCGSCMVYDNVRQNSSYDNMFPIIKYQYHKIFLRVHLVKNIEKLKNLVVILIKKDCFVDKPIRKSLALGLYKDVVPKEENRNNLKYTGISFVKSNTVLHEFMRYVGDSIKNIKISLFTEDMKTNCSKKITYVSIRGKSWEQECPIEFENLDKKDKIICLKSSLPLFALMYEKIQLYVCVQKGSIESSKVLKIEYEGENLDENTRKEMLNTPFLIFDSIRVLNGIGTKEN